MADPQRAAGDERPIAMPSELSPQTHPPGQPGEPTSVSPSKPVPIPEADLVLGSTLGPYRLLAKLGEGGMGAVYKAQHTKLDKVVAIKVLPAHLTRQASSIARFEREMKAVGKIDHPHIVRAMDAGEVNGMHYLAMEYVEGTDLLQLVKDRGPLSVVQVCRAIRQTALALAAAHGVGLVHRDIKPANLLLTKTGQIKLLDLGLALLGDEVGNSTELTAAGQIFGTADFMAPEQWEDAHAADARTDLYALGCTMYYLLVGHTPYGTDRYRTTVSKMKAHVTDPIPEFPATVSELPDGVRAIYRRLMAKSPTDRFQTATELAEALTPFSSLKGGSRVSASGASAASSSKIQIATDTGSGAASETVNQARPPAVIPAPATPPRRDTPTTALPISVSPRITVPTKSPSRGAPPSWFNRKFQLAAGGAAFLLVCGVIIITITSSNGTQTKIEVPDSSTIAIKKKSKRSSVATAKSATAGWYGWPADAPQPAVAPFSAEQAQQHQAAWAKYLQVPVEYANRIGMKFRLIPPGEFTMGSTPEEIEAALKFFSAEGFNHWTDCIKSEGPPHKVTLTQPIYLGTHEVTQAEYEKVIGTNPSHFVKTGTGKESVVGMETANHPVESVTWNEGAEFCAKLSQQEGLKPFYFRSGETVTPLDGTGYRLPTSAEWEMSCRAGATTKFWNGDQEENLLPVAWFNTNSGTRTHAVGELKANPFGLYDIHGNVWEWVQDGWEPTYYEQFKGKRAVDPTGPPSAELKRLVRGGGWDFNAFACRASDRSAHPAVERVVHVGFRVCLPVAAVRQALKSTGPAMPTPAATAPETANDPIDYAAERKAAEWLAKVMTVGYVTLLKEDGSIVGLNPENRALPAENFVVQLIWIPGSGVDDAGMANLAGCRRLLVCEIGVHPSLTTAGLKNLQQCRTLKELLIGYTEVDDGVFELLSSWPKLERLEINGTKVSDAGVAKMPDCPQLLSLRMAGTQVTDVGLTELVRHCPNLRSLGIQIEGGPRTCLPLAKLTQLKELHCSGDQVTEAGIAVLKNLPELEAVHLHSPTTDEAVARVCSLGSRLKLFQIFSWASWDTGVSEAAYQSLEQLTDLREILLTGHAGSPPDSALAKFAARPQLTTLHIGFDEPVRRYTAAGVAKFRELRPDVRLIVDGKDYSQTPGSTTPTPAVPLKTADNSPKIPLQPNVKSGEMAKKPASPAVASLTPNKNAPVKPPANPTSSALTYSKDNFKPKPGAPISPRAMVWSPAPIRDLASWSIEVAGHLGGASSLAVSPDGKFAATVSSGDDSIRIWNLDAAAQPPTITLDRVLLGESGGVWDVAWSPNGQALAVTSHHGHNVTVYDAISGQKLKAYSLGEGGGRSVQWSPDGRWISAPHYASLVIIDAVSGIAVRAKNGFPAMAGSWAPDGRQLATADEGGMLKIWNPIKVEQTAEIVAITSALNGGVAWSPDGRWIATGAVDGHVKIWDSGTRRMVKDLTGEQPEIYSVAWEPLPAPGDKKHPNWPRLMSTGSARAVIWDAVKGEKLVSMDLRGHCLKAAWTPDGKRVIGYRYDRPVMHDAESGQLLAEASTNGLANIQGASSHVTSDGKILRVLNGAELLIFNGELGEYVKRIGNVPTTTLAPSPKDDWIAIYDPNREQDQLVLIDTATYEQRRPLKGHVGNVTAVNWAPDGKFLASAGVDGVVRIWKAASGETTLELKHDRPLRNVVWSPNNKTVATCAEDDVIRLWSTETGKETKRFEPLVSPSAWGGTGIAWAPVGDLIAIAPRDAQARVLDVKSGKFSEPFVAFLGSMQSVAWSTDGKQLLVSNGNEIGYRAVNAKSSQLVYGHGLPMHWLNDKRRVLTGQGGAHPLQAVDTKRGSRLGVLYPSLIDGGWLCIGPDGHYRGSEGIEQHLVYVALHKDGSQTTHSAADFREQFSWKNDPEQATLLKANSK